MNDLVAEKWDVIDDSKQEILPPSEKWEIDVSDAVNAIGDIIAQDFKNYIEEIDGEVIEWQELAWRVFQRVCRDYKEDWSLFRHTGRLWEWMCKVVIAKPESQSVDTKICSLELWKKLADNANKQGLILWHVVTDDKPIINMEWINFFMEKN